LKTTLVDDTILDRFGFFGVRFAIRLFCWSHVSIKNVCNHKITRSLMFLWFKHLFYLN
jgi:hypothetical protein